MRNKAPSSNPLFGPLPFELEEDIRSLNPHWEGKPGPRIPPVRRWAFGRLLQNLRNGLTPATVLRGPRRVGKTVLLRQIMASLIADGVPPSSILYVALDEIGSIEKLQDPILLIARWFENKVLAKTFNEGARAGQPAYLLFDEVQNLQSWAPQIKHLVDNHDVRALITGSSSLRIESGRDSLAGRITSAGQAPGQSVFVPEIQQALAGNIGWNRILNYLRFLDGALLIRLVQPLELRLKRKKSPPKICLRDHALRASWLQEIVPMDAQGLSDNSHLTDIAGHLAESILGYFLCSIPGLDAAYFPTRGIEPEVDFVLTLGTRRIPIEVKYRRRIDPYEDTRGLRAFIEKAVYHAPFGLLITLEDDVAIADPRIIPISLSTFLWLR